MWYSGVGYVFLCSHYGSSSLEWEFDTSMIGGRDGTVIVYPRASLKWWNVVLHWTKRKIIVSLSRLHPFSLRQIVPSDSCAGVKNDF